ncbi:copper chaperone for superoxide dismutase isoform X2 [Hydra vulgaris]|uniref:Superoxide dismutase copper chaperone n=1 Tax=Hydra vulgaris TaxID=6087 RepID=A0ABM4BQZ4_HYDVU
MENLFDKMEFSVNMKDSSCVDKISSSLDQLQGIKSFEVDLDKQSVIVTTNLPSSIVQESLESTGMLAVYRGQGENSVNLGAAVAILKSGHQTYGLVRFVQKDLNSCIIDGSISKLSPFCKHAVHIHELGDLSNGCESTGDVYNPMPSTNEKIVGDLGNISADSKGNSIFKFIDHYIKVWDVIGRSVCLHEKDVDLKTSKHSDAGESIACGIIARSAGMLENLKKVCTCSGKTLWEEREETRVH